ncbi:MAG: succinyl-CoA ligase [ADP-forming] subunit beta [Candidatus Xenolissoclinum pacificiensis L6]|uniref:Succinate--CoA ligase [ADP-forming] subunit beta n=1 Tax=Candidatus Xenolissoclinum pacificiensis L6 TaxID=1401685 RepID=W2V0Q0_9RICK|nr:MAG: succinyl-CoA ligase [ADP-forming] subunit beta [Candidatus Xenolissoclinum pacificiensis L6]
MFKEQKVIDIPEPIALFATGCLKNKSFNLLNDYQGNVCVVKAQIHAGGRGKAGGVKVLDKTKNVMQVVDSMMGMQLHTVQTGPEGKKVHNIYIEGGVSFDQEYYLSVLLDRASETISFIASAEGGVDIEEVSEKHPEKIFKMFVNIKTGIIENEAQNFASMLGFSGQIVEQYIKLLDRLYRFASNNDALQIEMNPLVSDGQKFTALDAKISFDDNALYRQKEIRALRDLDEEDPKEVEATKFGLNYVKMNGSIGCMVNGAGLAMATMDIIKYHGSSPANFLDVGGGATLEAVSEAFRIVMADQGVKGILVNIFGGIMRCDIIAQGVVNTLKDTKSLNIPVVMRLVGTNVELGKEIIRKSGLNIHYVPELENASKKIVELAGGK